ncbi:OmpA family protein, partial [Azoarcus sp. L1K30]|nr:OmpA family protein [Azoarcus sp. L1K30]
MIIHSRLARFTLFSAVLASTTCAAMAQGKDVMVDGKGDIPYVIDGRNVVARSGAGLCWRTGYWSPAAAGAAMAGQFPAGCECDSDIVPKDKCAAPMAPPTAPSALSLL